MNTIRQVRRSPGLYTSFLGGILLGKAVSARTLNKMCGNRNVALWCKNRALRYRHIEMYHYKKRWGGSFWREYYTLTEEGCRYLLARCEAAGEQFPAEGELNFRALKLSDCAPELIDRLDGESLAMWCAASAGAAVPMENFTRGIFANRSRSPSEREDRALRQALMRSLYEQYGLFREQPEREDGITFYNSTLVKRNAGERSPGRSVRPWLCGRYRGIAQSARRTVLVYVPPQDGMNWTGWLMDREKEALRLWRGGEEKRAEAVMIVFGQEQMAHIYRDDDGRNRNGGGRIGGGLDSLFILPSSVAGVEQLRWLMETDDGAFDRQTVRDAAESGAYRPNTGPDAALFPLISEAGLPAGLGFRLDAKDMLRWEEAAHKNPGQGFEILCQPWQTDYYRAVMPEQCRTVPVEIA